MTATLTPPRLPTRDAVRRSLTFVATAGGALAALATLAACLGVGVVGWFLTDGGAHGQPRDGLRTGGMAWLMAHGSGVEVDGVPVTAIPLGLTMICAWVIWRFGLRVGESLAGHGPDAEALAAGQRDVTVPVTAGLFTAAYVIVAVLVYVFAAGSQELGPVILWSIVLAGLVGGAAITVGSGRAAVWLSLAPAAARATAYTMGVMLVFFLAASAIAFVVALLLDLGTALNVLSRLHTDTGDAVLFALLTLMVLPNAVLFSGAYLLGPGFAVGTGTLVSPSVVAVGPVPMFPLLAALPDNGPTPAWTPCLVVVPVLCAAGAAVWAGRRHPNTAWNQGALRGGLAGVLTGVVFGLLALVAGGAVGPGRMADVGPEAGQVLVHGIVSFGIGGLVGGLLVTWWSRRRTPVGSS